MTRAIESIAVTDYASRIGYATPIVEAVERALHGGSFEQRVWWNRVLTEAIDKLAPDAALPAGGMTEHALQFFCDLASRHALRSIAVVDYPDWLQRHWSAIRQEAARGQPDHDGSGRPTFVRPGPAALALSCDPGLHDWARQALGVRFGTRMKLTYIHYGQPGQRSRLHLDDPTFYEYNCLIGVHTTRPRRGLTPARGDATARQTANGSDTSAAATHSLLRVIDPQAGVRDFDLIDGRVVLFNGSRLPHARTPLVAGESVCVLSLGLNDATRESSAEILKAAKR